ncbi:MAG: InlB B-repeat-containing protein [Clostridiales Family XIII bacterium]|jgi:uncharacterized repeat protein (TIGR02543 family)|nr:InlB B-repeat-containing protein [Clostridiales Family XIII bacterium]
MIRRKGDISIGNNLKSGTTHRFVRSLLATTLCIAMVIPTMIPFRAFAAGESFIQPNPSAPAESIASTAGITHADTNNTDKDDSANGANVTKSQKKSKVTEPQASEQDDSAAKSADALKSSDAAKSVRKAIDSADAVKFVDALKSAGKAEPQASEQNDSATKKSAKSAGITEPNGTTKPDATTKSAGDATDSKDTAEPAGAAKSTHAAESTDNAKESTGATESTNIAKSTNKSTESTPAAKSTDKSAEPATHAKPTDKSAESATHAKSTDKSAESANTTESTDVVKSTPPTESTGTTKSNGKSTSTKPEPANPSASKSIAAMNLPIQATNLAANSNEIYISASGNDDEGNGTSEAPFATLAHAFETAATDNSPVKIYVLDNINVGELTSTKTNQNITLMKAGTASDTPILSRAGGFLDQFITVAPKSKLTIEDITMDGRGGIVAAKQAIISVGGTFELKSGTLRDNNNADANGGAIAVIGDDANAIISGGMITGNRAKLGDAIYFDSGKLTLKEKPGIGANPADGGIYLSTGKVLTIEGALSSGSCVNIEGMGAPTDGSTIASQSDGNSTSANATFLNWCTRAYDVKDGSNSAYVLGISNTDWYVGGADASDSKYTAGDETHPFATMDGVMRAIPKGKDIADIALYVKGDTTMAQPIIVDSVKSLTIEKWYGLSADQEVKIKRVATEPNKVNMFDIYKDSSLELKKVTLDGNKDEIANTGSPIFIRGGVFTLNGGKITNNKTLTNGGGVFVSEGVFNMIDGEITGNTAGGQGGEVYFYDGRMNISGSPIIGTENPKDGVWLGSKKAITLDGNLGPDSLIGIDGIENAAIGRVVVHKINGAITVDEAEKIIVSDNSWTVKPSDDESDSDYILSNPEYYIASPDGNYYGNDNNTGTVRKPFASLKKALSMVKDNIETTIYVMDDVTPVPADANAAIVGAKKVNLTKWRKATGEPRIIRDAAYKNIMLQVANTAVLTMSSITIDGANVSDVKYPAVSVVSATIATGTKFVMNSGSIINNINTETSDANALVGGAIRLTTSHSSTAEIIINGGVIAGNHSAAAGGGIHANGRAKVTINGGSIQDNIAATNGGGIYMNVNNVSNKDNGLTINGGKFTGNTAANGKAIHINNYAKFFNIGAHAQIGTNDNDNGLVIANTLGTLSTLTLTEDLASDARVNIEMIYNPYGGRNVVIKNTGTINADEAKQFVWQDDAPPFKVIKGATNNYKLSSINQFYVNAADAGTAPGDDNNSGTVQKPFASIAKAFAVSSNSEQTDVYVMSDLDMSAAATVSASRDIVLQGYGGSAHQVTRLGGTSPLLGAMISTVATSKLTLKDLTFDGNKSEVTGASGPVLALIGTTFEMRSGKIQNNANRLSGDVGYGGAIRMEGSVTATISGITLEDNEATKGGAIALRGNRDTKFSNVTITDTRIEDNHAASDGGALYLVGNKDSDTLKGVIGGDTVMTGNTAGNFGNAIYRDGYFRLSLSGEPKIGTNDADNGIYLVASTRYMQILGDLGGDARINVEFKTEHEYDDIIFQKKITIGGSLAHDESSKLHYQRAIFTIQQKQGTASNYILFNDRNEYYVSASGDDITGDGTRANPLASMWHAFNATQPDNPSTVYVMTDLTQKHRATVVDYKEVTLKKDAGNYPGGVANAPVITRDSEFTESLLQVDAGNPGGKLAMEDVTLNGNNAIPEKGHAIVLVTNAAGDNTNSLFVMKSGKIANFKGTAVLVNGEDNSTANGNKINNRKATFRMTGGEISGVLATAGTAIATKSGGSMIEISGSPIIGATDREAGITFGNVNSKISVIDELTNGARINLNSQSLSNNRLVATEEPATAMESKYFHSTTYEIIVNDDETGYIAVPNQFDFYIASAEGLYAGSDIDGTGGIDAPYASIAMAMREMPIVSGKPVTIHVMDHLTLTEAVVLRNSANVTLKSWYNNDSVVENPWTSVPSYGEAASEENRRIVLRGDNYGGTFIYSAANTNASFHFKDIILDGNRAHATTSTGQIISAIAGKFYLEEGAVIRNNYYTAASVLSGAITVGGPDDSSTNGTVPAEFYMEDGSLLENLTTWASYASPQSAVAVGASGGKFVMNGGEIRGTSAKNGCGIVGTIFGGLFTMNGGSIHDNSGGYAVLNKGTFVMNGGSIDHNSAGVSSEGDSWHAKKTTITFNGGEIKDNAGVGAIIEYATATMNNGAIINNVGGIAINGNVEFTMNDGEISANRGSGIYVGAANPVLNLLGGVIKNNTAAFPYTGIYTLGTINVGGSIRIGENASDNGLYLAGSNQKINIIKSLTEDAYINVAGKVGVTSRGVIAKKSDAALDGEAHQLHSQILGTKIIENPEDESEFVIASTDLYVASFDGAYHDKDAELGTVEAPFSNFDFIETLPATLASSIKIMDDVTVNKTIPMSGGKTLTFDKWENAAQASIIRDETFAGYLFDTDPANTATTITTFTLKDIAVDGNGGAITGKTNATILVRQRDILNIEGAKIINNSTVQTDANDTTSVGGGIYICGGTVNMSSGEISGNGSLATTYTAGNGGGGGVTMKRNLVSNVIYPGLFNMTGGTISGNKAQNGAAVAIVGGGNNVIDTPTFNMSGGVIEGNLTPSIGKGAGVYLANNTVTSVSNPIFNMSGGVIRENHLGIPAADLGSGVYFNAGSLNISGKVRIGENDADNSIYIDTLNPAAAVATLNITQRGDLASGSRINLGGKKAAEAGTQVITKTNKDGFNTGLHTTLLESDYYYWTDDAYRVVPAGDNSYMLAQMTNLYVSGASGDDFNEHTGDITLPYRTLEKAFSQAAKADGITKYSTIHILDDTNLIAMNAGVTVQNGQVITLKNSSGTDASVTRADGKLLTMFTVAEGGALVVKGLTIDGNGEKAPENNVVVRTFGTFAMENSSIKNNRSTHTSAVELDDNDNAAFMMDESKIYNNTSNNGSSAVNIKKGTFTLISGEITDNASANGSAAVVIGDGLFEMNSGRILRNSGGSAVRYTDGEMRISGDAKIGESKADNGIYLGKDKVIKLIGDLDSKTRINIENKEDSQKGTVITQKEYGAVTAEEAKLFYFQPGIYSIIEEANANVYILGALAVSFEDAAADGIADTKTSTTLTFAFSEYVGDIDEDNFHFGINDTSIHDFEIVSGSVTFDRKAIANGYDGKVWYYYTAKITGDWDEGDAIDSITFTLDGADVNSDTVANVILHRDTRTHLKVVSAIANGLANEETTTKLTITLDKDMPGITEGAITLANAAGVESINKGMLTKIAAPAGAPAGTAVYELPVTGLWAEGGTVNLTVSPISDRYCLDVDHVDCIVLHSDTRTYAVTFVDYDDETILDTQVVSHGAFAAKPSDPSRIGYVFDDWYKEKARGSAWAFDVDKITTTTAIYAKYDARTDIKLTFDKNGGVDGTTTQASVTYDSVVGELPSIGTGAPTRPGYVFGGWSTVSGADNTADFTADIIVDFENERTVYAVWIRDKYTVIFKDYDETQIGDVQVVAYEGAATAPKNPTRTGYTFKEWDTTFDKITANTVVTAVYTINKYTVTFKDYDGTIIGTTTVNYADDVVLFSAPRHESHTFVKWDNTGKCITEDTTITAVCKIKTYTVVFVNYDETVIKIQNVDYGNDATAPSSPTRDGYTFTGWDKEYADIKADLTVTAQYQQNEPPIVEPPVVNPPVVNPPTVNPPVVNPPVVNPPTVNPPVVNPPTVNPPTAGPTNNPPTADSTNNPPTAEPTNPKASTDTSAKDDLLIEPQEPKVGVNTAEIYNGFSGADQQKLETQTGNILSDLANGKVPLGFFGAKGVWSLLSLILSIIAVLSFAIFGIYGFSGKKKGADWNQEQYDENDRTERTKKNKKLVGILAGILAILTPVVWILLDDFSLKMAWVNNHTLFVGCIFVLYAISMVVFMAFKKKSDKLENEYYA